MSWPSSRLRRAISQGKVSPYGNQLVINASAEKIQEVRDLLQQLDTAPRRLLISVDTSESSFQDRDGYRVDGSISAGDAEVIAGRGEVRGRDQVRMIRRSTDSRNGGTQQVQATEGYPALIQIGQSVPLTSTSIGPYGQVYQNTQYRNVSQGFYVTASVTGDIVHVSISSNNDRVNPYQPGVINTQSTDTRVSGRLGEWIPLGGVSGENNSQDSAFLRQHCVIQEMRIDTGKREVMIPTIIDYFDTEKVYEALWKNAHRVQKRDVIDMPDPLISEVKVHLSKAHKAVYDKVINDRFAILGDKVLAPDNQSAVRHMGLRLISCPGEFDAKLAEQNELAKATIELVETISPAAGRKVVVFAYYKGALRQLQEMFKGYNPAVVYGDSADSKAEIDRFKNDPDCTMLLINWISGGAGLNLQIANFDLLIPALSSFRPSPASTAKVSCSWSTSTSCGSWAPCPTAT